MRWPTSLLYFVGSLRSSPLDGVSFRFCSIGRVASGDPSNFIPSRTSNAYFGWEIEMPSVEHATSIQRKHFSFLRSLIPNCSWRNALRVAIVVGSFPVMIISSTYIKTIVMNFHVASLVKREKSTMAYLKTTLEMAQENLEYQLREACFSPKSDLLSRQTKFSPCQL